MLALEDLKDLNEGDVISHVENSYETCFAANLEILIAYESVGSWGCDSSSWFLLRDKATGQLFETSGSHCSCYGLEGQWKPEPTTFEYLTSERFYLSTGGYNNDSSGNEAAVKAEIARLHSASVENQLAH